MKIENRIIKILIESFTEDCLEEIIKTQHPNEIDTFNFGLASADAAVRRIKTKWLNKLNKKENVNS
jgi:acyl carrier protein